MSNTLLTPEDAAAILKVSRRTVMNNLRSKALKGSKAGRFWRIKPKDLNEYIEGDVQGIFCSIIGKFGESWIKDKKNRDLVRRIAGKLWACDDVLPIDLQDELAYQIECFPKNKENKCGTGFNYGMAARALLDILDTIDPPPQRNQF